jgi:ABC-type branched-subunit amino acid transport system permease subunit
VGMSDESYYYVVLVVGALCAVLLWAVTRSRLGRLLRALSDSPEGLAAHGADTRILRLYVFCISAFVAALGGALLAGVSGSISGDSGGTYSYFNSLVMVAILACCGRRVLLGPLLAGVAFEVLKTYKIFTDIVPTSYQGVLFGGLAVLVAIQPSMRSQWRRRPSPLDGEPGKGIESSNPSGAMAL